MVSTYLYSWGYFNRPTSFISNNLRWHIPFNYWISVGAWLLVYITPQMALHIISEVGGKQTITYEYPWYTRPWLSEGGRFFSTVYCYANCVLKDRDNAHGYHTFGYNAINSTMNCTQQYNVFDQVRWINESRVRNIIENTWATIENGVVHIDCIEML